MVNCMKNPNFMTHYFFGGIAKHCKLAIFGTLAMLDHTHYTIDH